jgi:hypothetical protein
MAQRVRHIIIALAVLITGMNISAQQTEKLYLSGTGNDNTVNWEFFCTAGMKSGKWTTIPVPSCWELQGFGKYDYGFAKDSVRGKEQGLYKYSFTVPASWIGKMINIVFEGSMTDTEVKINGKSAGAIHQGAFYAFKYDITKLLKYGSSNLLEVTVSKHSANESVNAAERKADFWIFGGIFRPVWLEALPEEHITDILINTAADGYMVMKTFFEAKKADLFRLQLYSMEGVAIGEPINRVVINKDIALGYYVINGLIKNVKAWTPESPNLYIAEISLYHGNQPLHTIRKRIGFRSVNVMQRDGIYINGRKEKLRGVNRHSFWPTSGRTTSKKISIEDVQLMKDMNMNAVRMSHYPPDDHFLDVCDSLGLYVIDELAGWHGHYDTETGSKLLREMLRHDHNHPSVIIWANGNEGGHNFDLDVLFKTNDLQKRPVIHPWQLFGGVETQHYREYNYGIGNYNYGREITMPTEFLHGQFDGGHGAGLEDYWEAMWGDPLSAGGFLWDFADQGVVRKDKNDSLDTDKFRAADGIMGPYHQKEGSYYAIKEIWSPIHVEKKYLTYRFDGSFNIENRYTFTNTSQCTFKWRLASFRKENPFAPQQGDIPSPDIQPLQKGILKMTVPADWDHYDVLYLIAFGPDQKEIFTWSFPVKAPATIREEITNKSGNKKPVMEDAPYWYKITVDSLEIMINKENGLLQQVLNHRTFVPFNNGPMIQEGAINFANFTYHYGGNDLIISSTYDRKNNYNTLTWTIYPSGLVRMDVSYFPAEYFTSMVGVNFLLPEKYIKGVEYMGNGPYRVWKNRLKGNKFGIWNKEYNTTETGEAPWIYPEFKGYYSNMYWCKFITTEGSFKVFTDNEDLFLRLYRPAWKTDQWHNYEPLFPAADVSFMQGIPGIGSKTQRNETTGPMGSKNIFYDYEKDPSRALKLTLYFDFTGN